MSYKVIDPKGLAYSDDYGRQIINCGSEIPQKIIDSDLIRQETIDGLVKDKRVEIVGKLDSKKDIPVENKKDVPTQEKKPAKAGRKKGGK